MLKNTITILLIVASLSHANEKEEEKNCFLEFGYQASIQRVNGGFDSTYISTSASSGEEWEGLTDNLYLKIGRNFNLNEKYSLAPSLGFTQATLLADDYHNDAITLELPLFYKTELFDKSVKIGPSLKYIVYPSLYYNNRDGQVDFGVKNAFAYGIQSLWGENNTKFSLGLEYLNSANYSAKTTTGTSQLESNVEMNGLYLNLGLHLEF